MLNVVSVSDAVKLIKEKFNTITEKEFTHITNTCGRVTAEDIISKEDVPAFSRSTMDGFAVKASDTFGASDSIPAILDIKGEVFMGEEAAVIIEDGECIRISTGGMLPEGADAVIPVEVTEEETGDICLAYKSVSPFENVTRKGDDVRKNQIIIKSGTVLTPSHTGVLAAMGYNKICVRKKPLIGIVSTGDELVEITEKTDTGKIRDVNTYLLSSLMTKYGCEVKRYGIIRDEYKSLLSTINKASTECDCVLVSGGSSAGARDMTAKIISELGEVFIHGLAMKPGKPTIIGKIGEKAVFGLPGHPAACYFVTEIIVKHLIKILIGTEIRENINSYKISENISSNNGREEYICVRTDSETAYPVLGKSGIISLLSQADGYIRIERDCEGLKKGEEVKVYSF